MIRKRKSQIGEGDNQGMDIDLMEKSFSFSKKESIPKRTESIRNDRNITSKAADYHYPSLLGQDIEAAQLHKSASGYTQIIENMENPVGDILGLPAPKKISRIGIVNDLAAAKKVLTDKNDEPLNAIYKKCDTETKLIVESFKFISFRDLFRNPFNPTISRDEKITRIFYLSGFCICPIFGWIFAILYGFFCKERKTNKKIISISILSSIQILTCAFLFIVILLIVTRTDHSMTYCKDYNVVIKNKPVVNAKYNVVFFGPIKTNEWIQSRLAKIVENLGFNILAIGFPNIMHGIIKSKRHEFLKNAFLCAKVKPERSILFSYQLESALNFTIPYLEYNDKILGFFSFNKKFKKQNPKRVQLKETDIEYLSPQEHVFYDIYSSIVLKICLYKDKKKYYDAHYIVHHSFNKYHIRCSNSLTRDYNMVINNFNYNTTGDEVKHGNHEESDFKEVIDDFYQFLVFIKDIITENNIEFYKKLLCGNIMCEEKGAVCAF